MQAPVRRLLPAPVDLNSTKPRNIMNQMNNEFEEFGNMNNVEFSGVISSNRKKKSNTTMTTKCIPPLISVIDTTRSENFVIYEDSIDRNSEEPVKTPNALKPRKNIKRNTAISSIPIPKHVTGSTRTTRSKRT